MDSFGRVALVKVGSEPPRFIFLLWSALLVQSARVAFSSPQTHPSLFPGRAGQRSGYSVLFLAVRCHHS